MRKSELVLAIALLGSASAAIWLWTELRAERAHYAEMSARVASLPSSIASPVAAPAVSSRPAPAAPVSPVTSLPATSSARVQQSEQEQAEASQRRRLQEPKYREAWRAQMRLNYTLRRDNVIRLLGFTPEEADAVVEIAIDRQLSWIDSATEGSLSPEDVQQQQAAFERGKREDEAKLRELLGDAKLAKFQEYMETRDTRLHVDQLRARFTGADTLGDDQVEPLIAALHVERTRLRNEQQEYRRMASPDNPSSVRQDGERELELLKAAHERMHTAVAPILTASQLKRFDVLQQRELERHELQGRLQSDAPDEDPATAR